MKVEIYVTKKHPLPIRKFPGFYHEKQYLWSAYMPEKESKKYVRLAKRYGFKYRCFNEKYERSVNYRYTYIKNNPPVNGKYRCVYCGKEIWKDDMEVDHILPASKAKTSKRIQRKLKTENGVNDLSNLVPSCHKCNAKKLDSTALKWRIKASLGRHTSYWVARKIMVLVIAMIIVSYCSNLDLQLEKVIEVVIRLNPIENIKKLEMGVLPTKIAWFHLLLI